MCNFLSFVVSSDDKGLKANFAHSLNSHSDIRVPGYECEWLDDDSIEVRLPPGESESKADFVREWIKKSWSTRNSLINYAIQSLDWSDKSLDLSGTQIGRAHV